MKRTVRFQEKTSDKQTPNGCLLLLMTLGDSMPFSTVSVHSVGAEALQTEARRLAPRMRALPGGPAGKGAV